MSSPSETFFTSTQVLVVKDLQNGQYTVDAVESDPITGAPDLHDGNRKELKLTTPVPGLVLRGYYDPDNKEIGLYVTFLGAQIGNKYTASLDDGLTVTTRLALLKQKIHIYKKDSKLRFGYDITFGVWPVTKHFKEDIALFNL